MKMINNKEKIRKLNRELLPYVIGFAAIIVFLQLFFDGIIISLIKIILWVIFLVFIFNFSKKYPKKD